MTLVLITEGTNLRPSKEFCLNLNGSLSSITVIALGRDFQDGPGCMASGFFTQLFVQAVDCNMLVIAVTLFYIVTHDFAFIKPPPKVKLALLIAPWILPNITAVTALLLNYYHPASGSWCWIQAEPNYLRYVFTHGWRFVIIITVVTIGFRVRVYLKKFKMESKEFLGLGSRMSVFASSSDSDATDKWQMEPPPPGSALRKRSMAAAVGSQESFEMVESSSFDKDQGVVFREIELETTKVDISLTTAEKLKILLVGGYPLFYVVLWLPGIANRVAEATGHSVRILQILQASTSYIGFANAATFGWNEIRERFSVDQLLEMLLGFMLGN